MKIRDEKLTSENISIACLVLFGVLIAFALINGLVEVVL